MRRKPTKFPIVLTVALICGSACASCGNDVPAATEGMGTSVYTFTLTTLNSKYSPETIESLFELKLNDANPALNPALLRVTAGTHEGTPTIMTFAMTTDADHDGNFGKGDVVTVLEPSPGFLGAVDVGATKDITIAVDHGDGSSPRYVEIGILTWIP